MTSMNSPEYLAWREEKAKEIIGTSELLYSIFRDADYKEQVALVAHPNCKQGLEHVRNFARALGYPAGRISDEGLKFPVVNRRRKFIELVLKCASNCGCGSTGCIWEMILKAHATTQPGVLCCFWYGQEFEVAYLNPTPEQNTQTTFVGHNRLVH